MQTSEQTSDAVDPLSLDIYSVAEGEALLRKAVEAYYNGTPIMQDGEYDALWRRHLEARRVRPDAPNWQDTILDKVGAAPPTTSGFQKVKHSTPMLSLDNVFEDENDGCPGIGEWLASVSQKLGDDIVVCVEPKIDGLSLRLSYVGGFLVRAVTRGSGEEGEDVSANVAASKLVPMQISRQMDLEVNGEVFMDFPTFERLNAELAAKGEEPYANPRNAAAGAIRLHDPQECAKRGLRFIPHGVIGGMFTEHSAALTFLARNGFECLEEVCLMATDKVTSVADWRLRVANDLNYPIDGLVFKLDDHRLQAAMGVTSRAPRWAVALKFQQEKVITRLKAITIQVGRSGVLTPIAELHPVWVDGSTVSRATLHNEDQIRRLGLHVGDDVEIYKAGAIIPAVKRSVSADYRRRELERYYAAQHPDDTPEALRGAVEQGMAAERAPFDLLRHIGGKCPSCGSMDIRKYSAMEEKVEERAAYRCFNPDCPAQLAARIQHMCSRKALNIEGIGEEASTALAEAMAMMNVSDPIDILEWTVNDLMALNWTTESGGTMTFGESRARKAFDAIQTAKSLPLHRWLFALGIPSIGENTSKEISRLFATTDELALGCEQNGEIRLIAKGASKDCERLARYQISSHLGPVSCQALLDYLHSNSGRATMLRLHWEFGVKSDNYNPVPVIEASTDKPLVGQVFAITGTLSVSRDDMKALIENAGGKVSGTISKKLTALICGDGGGGKRDKAQAAGIATLDEAGIRELL